MASAPAAGKTARREARREAERYPYGSRPIAALLPRLTGPAFRQRSPLAARLVADWETIVGPAVAAVTVPDRLRAGVLTICCAGPIALELQHLAPKLIERINIHFGQVLATRLAFRQIPPARPAVPPPPAPPSPDAEAVLAARVAGLEEGPLREAFLRLGRAMLSGR
ncbi:MAG: DciA family protein [Acetobacteraceae bacterium]